MSTSQPCKANTPVYTKREVSRHDPLFNDFSQRLRTTVCTHPITGYKYRLKVDKILAVYADWSFNFDRGSICASC